MSATKFCDSGSASPITFQHPSVAGRPEDRAEEDLQTGRQMQIRRVTVKLKVATRNGETELHILTNLPLNDAYASQRASPLKQLASNTSPQKFQKCKRGPKFPQPDRKDSENGQHVASAKILARRKDLISYLHWEAGHVPNAV